MTPDAPEIGSLFREFGRDPDRHFRVVSVIEGTVFFDRNGGRVNVTPAEVAAN